MNDNSNNNNNNNNNTSIRIYASETKIESRLKLK